MYTNLFFQFFKVVWEGSVIPLRSRSPSLLLAFLNAHYYLSLSIDLSIDRVSELWLLSSAMTKTWI